MNDHLEVDRLKSLRMDPATGTLQRTTMRVVVMASVVLIVAGQMRAWMGTEVPTGEQDVLHLLASFPSGHAMVMLGLLVGVAAPMIRAILLAAWFARRRERAMVALSLLVVAIMLLGLLLRH